MDGGLGRLTIERVALESGVGKPTIYRNWANAQELAMAAFMADPDPDHIDVAGGRSRSARKALENHLRAVVASFNSTRGRQITLTMASADPDSELGKAFRSQVIFKSREIGRELLERGAANGEWGVPPDIDVVLDLIYGPVFYRLLTGHLPANDAFARELVRLVLDGLS